RLRSVARDHRARARRLAHRARAARLRALLSLRTHHVRLRGTAARAPARHARRNCYGRRTTHGANRPVTHRTDLLLVGAPALCAEHNEPPRARLNCSFT